jgi:hypothetical protein
VPFEISPFQLPCGARAARVKSYGFFTGDDAATMLKQWEPGGPLYGMPSLVLTGEMTVMTPEARSYFSSWKEPSETEWYAIVVVNPVMRVVSNFILRVSGTTRRRLFTSEDEALRWLDERVREDLAKAK